MSYTKVVSCCVCLIVIFSGCSAQSYEDQMVSTSNRIINTIDKKDERAFRDAIGVKLLQIGKNDELLHFDFEKLVRFHKKYLADQKVTVQVTDKYDEGGSRKVIIPFSPKPGSKSKDTVYLELYFGPPQFVPLNKIADYEIVSNEKKGGPIVAPPKMGN